MAMVVAAVPGAGGITVGTEAGGITAGMEAGAAAGGIAAGTEAGAAAGDGTTQVIMAPVMAAGVPHAAAAAAAEDAAIRSRLLHHPLLAAATTSPSSCLFRSPPPSLTPFPTRGGRSNSLAKGAGASRHPVSARSSSAGDHRHFEGREEPYIFTTPEALIEDFLADVKKLRGEL